MKYVTTWVVGILLIMSCAVSAHAGDPPRIVWIKAKCALCHGEDGSGQTKHGKETHAPDLRSAEVQQLTDAELSRRIANGHSHMPSFRSALTREQVSALVVYIRSFAPKK